MINIIHQAVPGYYTESDQVNRIRYQLVSTTDGVNYTTTTNQFRCRDYFNDFAVYLQTQKEFSVYGMKSSAVVPDSEGGVWVLLHNCTKSLIGNIERSINTEIATTYGFTITTLELPKDKVLIYIPAGGWKSTFRTSFISLMLRNANVDRDIHDYDDLIDDDFKNDGHLDDIRYEMLKQRAYRFPSEEKYVWFCSAQYNSEKDWAGGISVHDNGIMGYTFYLIDEIKANIELETVADIKPNCEYDPEAMIGEEDDLDWDKF